MAAEPGSARVALPDCSTVPEDVENDDLSHALATAEVIRALAEEGLSGVRRLLQSEAGSNPELARRLTRLRERFRRQASSQIARVLEAYDQRVAELEATARRQEDDLERERRALEERLAEARRVDLHGVLDAELLPEIEHALVVPTASWMQPPAPPSIWERIRAFFARIADFFRRLFRRSGAARPARSTARTLPIAAVLSSGRTLAPSELGDVLARLTPQQEDELRAGVARQFTDRERALRREAEEKRRQSEAQRRRLEEEREEARRRAERDAEHFTREAESRQLERELKERGFVAERGGQLSVTYALVERFARLVLQEESRALPGSGQTLLRGGASTGVYEKARLRIADEVAHLDIPSSLLAARQEGSRHIDERTSYVFREITAERVHAVLALDKSGSMGERGKLAAAKKALLALYVAVRRRYPDAVVDVLAFDNDVRLLDLLELWETPPGSFTNTGEALRTAFLLLRASRATRKEFFLVTDGLPESYTDVDGRVRSGNLDRALEYALARAQELRTVSPLRFTMILIKSEHPEYEKAARLLTRELSGELVVTEPERLGIELLVRWASGREQARREVRSPAVASPSKVPMPPTGTTRRGGQRRRKADRRMGG
jgi:Mg-chelatase subunit ChlD